MRKLGFVFVISLLALHCASSNARDDSRFSYQNLYQDRYERGNGGVIPITIDRGESYSGTISRDQKYLYFSSNTSGNYDLYLRDLSDVFSIPVVSKVTNQREPTISPDGKYLAYVDDELDPDGDIMLLKVNPKKLIKSFTEGDSAGEDRLNANAKNLTNSEKNRIRARDANPTWSPDGNWIAWSTDLVPQKADDLGAGAGALQNIWIMPASSPEKKRQLTTEGGVMPSFSPDGKRIVYISYQDKDSNGAVYELEIATGATRRLTSGKFLNLYPSYTPDKAAIILTRIDVDTNGDGTIDRKDAGQIIRIDPQNLAKDIPFEKNEDISVPDASHVALTADTDNVFDSRVSNFIGGSILLAQVKGEDINIGFIPLSGEIPVKPDILQQEEYLATLMKKSKRKDSPCLGFEQLPSAFLSSPDLIIYRTLSRVRQSMCDKKIAQDLAKELAQDGTKERELYQLLNDLSNITPDYVDIKNALSLEPLADTKDADLYFKKISTQKNLWAKFKPIEEKDAEEDASEPKDEANVEENKKIEKKALATLKTETQNDKDLLAIQTFIHREEAKNFIREGKHREATRAIQKILEINPKYIGLDELFLLNGILDSSTLIAPEIVFLLAEKPDNKILPKYFAKKTITVETIPIRTVIRRRAERFFSEFLRKQFSEGNTTQQEQSIQELPEKNYRILHAMLALQTARAKIKAGEYEEASAAAKRSLALSTVGTINYFDGQLQLARIAEVKEGAAAAFKIHESAIQNFRDTEIPQYAKLIISKNRTYHLERAQRFSAERNDRAAAAEYMALLDLFLSTHAARLTSELSPGEVLETVLNLDDVALRAARKESSDEKLVADITKFYDSRINLARRFLVTEFIFGRGYFQAQLGINEHVAAEIEGITRSDKKKVFEHFHKAEADFNWSFFANARFADAYIMLGWMYQFIDEKREVVLDSSSGKRDREIFESLYKQYFPDYLFEKNIRLYQKTLNLFAQAGSKRVKNSFHLNIANNYFLLNNYSQAEEHYVAILDKRGNPDFRFETPEQEMMFYYHFGRTLYFSGKNEIAGRYLQFVENNLNPRYPIVGVSTQVQNINFERRAIAYKVFALNSEYSGQIARAINYHNTILNEAKSVGSSASMSLSNLELARLYLKQGNYASALWQTEQAERALAKEKEIPIPKFKIRVKWFWVYEPWTTIVGWIYKLDYDDIYIGENHLAFDLPTVNRYQLLYSIRAEIYKHRGLIQEASTSLAKLVEYAEKDKTKHGKETLAAAVSRRGELEYQLQNWDSAISLYQTAFKQAEKDKNLKAANNFRKNILLCKLRKLETSHESLSSSIKAAEKNAEEVTDYENDFVAARLKAERKRLKELEDGEIQELTDARAEKIALDARLEIQPILYFKAMNLAHAAALYDFKDRFEAREESFDEYLKHKQINFTRMNSALRYFRGYTQDAKEEIAREYDPDLKNNALRIKLAMNRTRLLQEMGLFEETARELKEIQVRSQEFRSDLIYALAMYRTYRTYEIAGLKEQLNIGPYKILVDYFLKHPNFMRANNDLFERLSNIVTERAIEEKNFAEALRVEDSRRQAIGLQVYFDNFKFPESKSNFFDELLALEQQRYVLAQQIEAGRFNRMQVQPLEKALVSADNRTLELRRQLSQPDKYAYHYDSLFNYGYSDNDFNLLAKNGLLYALKSRNNLVYIFAKGNGGRKFTVSYKLLSVEQDDDPAVILEDFIAQTKPATLVLSPELLAAAQENESLRTLNNQTTIRATLNFIANAAQAKRSAMQVVKTGTFLGFSSSNELRYKAPVAFTYPSSWKDFRDLKTHSNIIDYEADLVKRGYVSDTAAHTPAEFFDLKGNPNYAVVSYVARDKLNPKDNFQYASASDLLYSALGAGQVLHTFTSRKNSQAVMENFLAGEDPLAAPLVTGRSTNEEIELRSTKVLESQRTLYLKKISSARQNRDFGMATLYAEDLLSFFPEDTNYRLLAAELNFISGNTAAAKHLVAEAQISDTAPLLVRKNYARLLLRSGAIDEARTFIEDNADVARALSAESAETEGVFQLSAFETGNIENLSGEFPWGKSVSGVADTLRTKIPRTLKSTEVFNDTCSAAMLSLEYALVINSCGAVKNATDGMRENQRLIRKWFTEGIADLQIAADNNNLDLLQALSLLKNGFTTDALYFAKKFLVRTELSVSENLLAFSLLRIFSQRQANSEDTKNIAQILSDYGSAALKKAKNTQARNFYALLQATKDIEKKGFSAFLEATKTPHTAWTSGVQSAYNNLYLAALTVNPGHQTESTWTTTGFAADKKIESDTKFFRANRTRERLENIACEKNNCALLVKNFLTQDNTNAALQLVFQMQDVEEVDIEKIPDGAFGYIELFTDEVYEWFKDGKKIKFSRFDKFDAKELANVRRGRKYLAYTPRRNLFVRYKVPAPRSVVLADIGAMDISQKYDFTALSFASPEPTTLYSALYAEWGQPKKRQSTPYIQIKPPFHKASGKLNIYTNTINMADLPQLKPSAYHLFCSQEEQYNSFALFAQSMVRLMAQKKLSVEDAYEAAFAKTPQKADKSRPQYYLYRN